MKTVESFIINKDFKRMGLLGTFENYANEFLGETIPKSVDSKDRFFQLLVSSRKSLHIVAGELDPTFYSSQMANILREKLDDLFSYSIHILFHKETDKERAIQKTCEENSTLIKLFLNPEYTEHINLYWASKRPRYHFIVADNHTLLEEKDHERRATRDVYIRCNDDNLADRYRAHFNSMIKKDEIVYKYLPSDFEKYVEV